MSISKMMSKSRRNHPEKAANGFSWSNLKLKLEPLLFSLLILFLPTQLGKHFWPDFAIVTGIRIDYLSPTLYLTDLLIFALFIVWLFNNARKIKLKQINKIKTSIIFGLYLIFNILLNHDLANGFYHLLKFGEFAFVAYYIAMTIKTSKQLAKLALLLSVGVVFESILAISQFLKQASLGGIFYYFGERLFSGTTPGIANASINGALVLRPYGTFSHPNVLAGFLLISMLINFFTQRLQKGWARVLAVAAVLIGSSALLLTLSRIANLLWLLVLLMVFVSQIKIQVLKRTKTKLILLLTVCLFLIIIGNSMFGERLWQTSFTEESVVQRQELILSSVKLISINPFFGIGLGNFLPALPLVQKHFSTGFYLQPVHNIFLLVFAETGVVGFAFLSWFLIKTYRRLFNFSHRLAIILLTVVLILGTFDHYFITIQQGQLLLALVIGLTWITQLSCAEP